MKTKFLVTLALLAIFAVLVTACGGNDTAPVSDTTENNASNAGNQQVANGAPANQQADESTEDEMITFDFAFYLDPLAQSGDVVSAGSSTVFPLASKMAERLGDEGFPGTITIDSIGSGAGFERFCEAGETDVANASRPIKDGEIDACAAIGRTPIEFRVGTDAVAVVVSAENDFLPESITMEQLALIFSTAEKWSDVDPAWPAENILRYAPGTDSGTFDFFVEEVLDDDKAPILNSTGTQFSEDDNTLVQGVLGSPYAISFFGYAYYAENADTLRILTLNDVPPTRENVDSFAYPLARPLFIYSDAAIMQEKPQVASYILYFLTYVNEEIIDVGYFPASPDDIGGALDAWIIAMSQ